MKAMARQCVLDLEVYILIIPCYKLLFGHVQVEQVKVATTMWVNCLKGKSVFLNQVSCPKMRSQFDDDTSLVTTNNFGYRNF